MESTFLGELTQEEFLNNYWNKKPLLIRQAIQDTEDFADFDDFLEMSKDEEFETRMVYQSGGDYPWQAKSGPFTDSDFHPDSLWTLICHNLDLLSSTFFDLKKNVHFIPDWNFDDVMATISKKSASVGAHIDDYSVFILQGKGSRKWLLEENPNQDYIPNLDIKLLKTFNPTIEWILEPGDMIYIPPNVAHHGISLKDSISYSLGFKSIRYNHLIDHYISQIINQVEDLSFHDKNIIPQSDPFEVQNYVVDKIYDEVMKIVSNKVLFKQSLLNFLSKPKNLIGSIEEIELNKIATELENGAYFKRDIWAKLVINKSLNGIYTLFINNKSYELNVETYSKINQLFLLEGDDESKLSKTDIKNQDLVNLMSKLICDGVFYLSQ